MSIVGQTRRASFAVESRTGKAVTMSSAKVDRVGDVIDQAGWKLAEFTKNPVMLYNHNHDEPVGIWQDVKVEGGKLTGVPVFHPASINPFAGKLAALYEGGYLKGFSVGFRVLAAEPIPGGNGGWLIKEAELIECSAVVIPANTDALLGAKAGARIVPIFGAEPPAERRREGRDDEAIRKWVAPATASRVESAPMTLADVQAMIDAALAKALGSIKDEPKQPAPPPADKAPADGTDAGSEEEDLVAVEIAEAEAEAAELEELAAEIENETGTEGAA